ncbi:MAG: thioesterase family protein [Rhizomicrobium sp.]
MEAIFRVDGPDIQTREHAGGPWDPSMQHGGAASSLVVWAAERIASRVPMRIARVTVDLLKPVPVAPLTYKAEVVREGAKIQLCAVSLFAQGKECLRASVLKIRAGAAPLPGTVRETPLGAPHPDDCTVPDAMRLTTTPFLTGIDSRPARGSFRTPGPAAVWYRLLRPPVEGFDISPVMRAVVAADFCNGTSAVVDFDAWTFINADLTLSLARYPVGDWILLDSETWAGPEGAAIAFARLADLNGTFGRASQSVLLEPR